MILIHQEKKHYIPTIYVYALHNISTILLIHLWNEAIKLHFPMFYCQQIIYNTLYSVIMTLFAFFLSKESYHYLPWSNHIWSVPERTLCSIPSAQVTDTLLNWELSKCVASWFFFCALDLCIKYQLDTSDNIACGGNALSRFLFWNTIPVTPAMRVLTAVSHLQGLSWPKRVLTQCHVPFWG